MCCNVGEGFSLPLQTKNRQTYYFRAEINGSFVGDDALHRPATDITIRCERHIVRGRGNPSPTSCDRPFESRYILSATKKDIQSDVLFYGGKGGIRTLERVLAVTRFPVVRLRPAQPPFRVRSLNRSAIIS